MQRGLYDWCSGWVDDLTFLFIVLTEKKRGFELTRPGTQPPSFDALREEVRGCPPKLDLPAGRPRRGRFHVQAAGLRGEAAAFDFLPATEAEDPRTLIVYHHGLGEIPHDTVPRVLRRSTGLHADCDWVVWKGFHHSSLAEVSARLTSHRDHFLRCLAYSAGMVRELGIALRPHYDHLVLCGTSMGGIITLLEAADDPQFDVYVPLVAGPNLQDVLTRSAFTRSVQSAWVRRARRERWAEAFDLTGRLADCPGPPIRAILARGDRLFRLERQLEAYAAIPRATAVTCAGGHITGAANIPSVSKHLRDSIAEVCWSAPEPALV